MKYRGECFLSVRSAAPDDRDNLLALNAYGLAAAGIAVEDDYYGSADFDDMEATYSTKRGGALLVGEVDGKIVAMGGIRRIDDASCELLRMRVSPEYQGRGYGTALLVLLEDEAKRLGYRRVDLLTGEHQRPAVDIYGANGYVVTKKETLLGIPSVRMSKDLTPSAPSESANID